jgi:Fic family protein
MNAGLRERCQQVVAEYPPELLRRALSYLYTKETRSSFEIEHIKPSASRTERFITLLELAEKEDFCDKARLIDLQNRIVDPRFADADYRTSQNYVGESVVWQTERVHYACPKPADLPGLMAGLIEAHGRMGGDGIHAVLHAAAVAYGFVFLHPFEDGNGRIHRFLIHNILARRGFTPEGLMFPVSAAMLKNPGEYDASLEAFSKPLMPLMEYELDDEGRMNVLNETAVWYRFIDMTPQAEALFAFIEKTIETELVEELNFLANYDRAKAAIQEVVDMPDRQIDLFIRFCLQNHGRLSARKRSSHFAALTDDEIARMEQAVQVACHEADEDVLDDWDATAADGDWS